ncbi:MAG: decaprenyl-phosphate phosphoribosyltransferase [Armatimonadota bacterium]
MPIALLLALRPKQWTKNLLVFAGLVFTANQAHTPDQFLKAFAAFAIFCLLSGCAYLLNDLQDIEADRQHPRKRLRPIASGDLPPNAARAFFTVFTPLALFLAWCINPAFLVLAALYLLVTVAYSFQLKHIVLLDVLALASGFVLRAAAGALAIGVETSVWLLLCTLLLALFLALTKRRSEIVALGDSPATRPILTEYSLPMLDQMINIVASACLMAYSLYTFNSPTAGKRHYLMATIPFVLYGLFRYLYLSHSKGMGEAPETVLIEDKPLLINIVLYLITAIIAVRFSQ